MRIGFILPHIEECGSIRRILEFSNRFVGRGHRVFYFIPTAQPLTCTWMECLAEIRHLDEDGYETELDAILFMDDSQYMEVPRFRRVCMTVNLHLVFGKLHDNPFHHQAVRLPVDLRIASSAWTADRISEEIGERPVVIPGGINPDHFHPVPVAKEYDVLCRGTRKHHFKGMTDVEVAVGIAGYSLECYDGKNISLQEMCCEISRARIFVSGCWHEGFNQCGLEALACGVPLVITDEGGSREYAVHEETALVVPPRDPVEMATAITRLMNDTDLQDHLVQNGLALVNERFDRDRNADRFLQVLQARMEALRARKQWCSGPGPVVASPVSPVHAREIMQKMESFTRPLAVNGTTPGRNETALTSLLVLPGLEPAGQQAWIREIENALVVPHETIPLGPDSTSGGPASWKNLGLESARGEYVAVVRAGVSLPPGWLDVLLNALDRSEDAGLVVPVAVGLESDRTVLPGASVLEVRPYSFCPATDCLVARADVLRLVGGWSVHHDDGDIEDMDLMFALWSAGKQVLLDERVVLRSNRPGSRPSLDWARAQAVFAPRWKIPGVQGARPVGLGLEPVEMGLKRLDRDLHAIEQLLRDPETGASGTVCTLFKELLKSVTSYRDFSRRLAACTAEGRDGQGRILSHLRELQMANGRRLKNISREYRKRKSRRKSLEKRLRSLDGGKKDRGSAEESAFKVKGPILYPSFEKYLWQKYGKRRFSNTVVERSLRTGLRAGTRIWKVVMRPRSRNTTDPHPS